MTTFRNSAQIGVQGQRTLPAAHYTDAAHFAEEQRRIFERRWLCVCRADELPKAGDFRRIEIGRESLLIVRGTDGVIRAHFNVCRHRGTRLCEGASGSLGRTIRCPYHAWTYALDGRLIGVPDLDDMGDFDKAAHGLHAAACETWEGFVWISLAEDAEPFASAFAPLLGKWSAYGLDRLVRLGAVEYDVRANWKLVVQNYSECYHCAPVHPGLSKLSPPTSGGNDLVEGPFLGGFMDVTEPGGSLTMSGRACGVPVGDLPADDRQRVYYYVLFPNALLSLHHDYVMVHRLWPVAPDRTRIECEWLFHPATAADPAFDPQDGIAFWDHTNREDWHVCELTQLGVQSARYRPGPYSAREAMAAAFDREYRRAMGEAP
jgi:Rieske 2Fe-2S family protein